MKPFADRVIEALARHERAAAELGQIKKGILSELGKLRGDEQPQHQKSREVVN